MPAAVSRLAAAAETDDVIVTAPLGDGGSVGQRGRRSKILVGSAVLAVLAVGAAGIFAVANLTRAAVGGADTPADLGTELLQAIEAEDVLGVIDVLVPGERQTLGDPFVDVIMELQRLEVLADADLSQIAGLDIELSNEVVRTKLTNVDDIVNIAMSADVEVRVDGAQLPLGALVTDNLPDDAVAELQGTRITENDQFDISLTAVLEDGRWYFSLLHTVAELARADLDNVEIPLEGVGHDGASTPEDAVNQFLDRIEELDLTGLIRALDPAEAAALQRYAPLFLEDAQRAADEVGLNLTIGDRSFRAEGSGGQRTVSFDGLSIEGSIDGDTVSFAFDGDCVTAEADGERVEQCGSIGGLSDVDDMFGDAPEITHLIEVVQAAFADMEPVGLELRSRDGAWFVSPIASVTDALLAMLRALDRQELDEIIGAVEPATDAFVDGIFGRFDEFYTDEYDYEELSPIDDTLPWDELPMPEPSDTASWYDCYELDTVDATACFASAVAAGEVDQSEVPAVLRFPECGYADASWGGAVYGMPDDEFMAVAAPARECFLALVEQGQIDQSELPDELVQLECFEGRNWYQVFDDPEYDLRVDECRSSLAGA